MRYCLIQKNKVIRNLKKINNQLNAFIMCCNIDLTNDEMNQYSRQIRLPEVGKEGQKRIKGSSVVVIEVQEHWVLNKPLVYGAVDRPKGSTTLLKLSDSIYGTIVLRNDFRSG